MKVTKIALACATALFFASEVSAAYDLKKKVGAQDTKLSIYGFSQLEARGGDGVIKDDQEASVKFGAQRVRLGMNYTAGKVRGKLFLDFNRPHDDAGGVGLPDMIKDAFITYFADPALAIKVGLIKMPHGMSFTIPGWNLDIVERGFDKKLSMERNVGIMLSGRGIGYEGNKVNGYEMGHERPWKGFGYDVMIANQAGRSGAVTAAKAGNANSYAVRAMYDWTELFHAEVSYAISENAGGIKGQTVSGTALTDHTEDYKSLNFGIDSHYNELNGKFEMFQSENIKGVEGWDESTYALTGTYYVTPTLEASLKHIMGEAEKGGVETDLSNTYIGFNYYIEPFDDKMSRGAKRKRNAHRMQFNYVMADGDTDTWNGLGGYKDDAWLFQYQYKF